MSNPHIHNKSYLDDSHTSFAYLVTNTKHLHSRYKKMKLHWCIHTECLCSTGVFMKRHTLWLSRMPSAMNQRMFHSLSVSEHMQLVIW